MNVCIIFIFDVGDEDSIKRMAILAFMKYELENFDKYSDVLEIDGN